MADGCGFLFIANQFDNGEQQIHLKHDSYSIEPMSHESLLASRGLIIYRAQNKPLPALLKVCNLRRFFNETPEVQSKRVLEMDESGNR